MGHVGEGIGSQGACRRILLTTLACAGILVASANGAAAAPQGAITNFSAGLNPGPLLFAIAPGPDGNLWFTDGGATDSIGRITPTGAITMFSAGLNPGAEPFGIAPGPDGALWFTDNPGATDAIGRISTTGAITEFSAGLNAGAILGQIAPGSA